MVPLLSSLGVEVAAPLICRSQHFTSPSLADVSRYLPGSPSETKRTDDIQFRLHRNDVSGLCVDTFEIAPVPRPASVPSVQQSPDKGDFVGDTLVATRCKNCANGCDSEDSSEGARWGSELGYMAGTRDSEVGAEWSGERLKMLAKPLAPPHARRLA